MHKKFLKRKKSLRNQRRSIFFMIIFGYNVVKMKKKQHVFRYILAENKITTFRICVSIYSRLNIQIKKCLKRRGISTDHMFMLYPSQDQHHHSGYCTFIFLQCTSHTFLRDTKNYYDFFSPIFDIFNFYLQKLKHVWNIKNINTPRPVPFQN